MAHKHLIKAALKAKKHSHSPYSKLKVGAAIITKDGKIFTGCNIESSSFSLTICAERTALFKAISEGYKKFSAIAIVSNSRYPIPPCGACRQVLSDLAGNIDIILIDKKGNEKVNKLSAYLPTPFTNKLIYNK